MEITFKSKIAIDRLGNTVLDGTPIVKDGQIYSLFVWLAAGG
jgi:hypothetical protein